MNKLEKLQEATMLALHNKKSIKEDINSSKQLEKVMDILYPEIKSIFIENGIDLDKLKSSYCNIELKDLETLIEKITENIDCTEYANYVGTNNIETQYNIEQKENNLIVDLWDVNTFESIEKIIF